MVIAVRKSRRSSFSDAVFAVCRSSEKQVRQGDFSKKAKGLIFQGLPEFVNHGKSTPAKKPLP
jgi:hypothetical protein